MLPNCKIQIFKTFKRMRLLPKKRILRKSTYRKYSSRSVAFICKTRIQYSPDVFRSANNCLTQKVLLLFNCASRRLLCRRRNSIKTNKSKIASFSSAILNVVFIILNTKVRLPSPLPSCRFSLGRRRTRRR